MSSGGRVRAARGHARIHGQREKVRVETAVDGVLSDRIRSPRGARTLLRLTTGSLRTGMGMVFHDGKRFGFSLQSPAGNKKPLRCGPEGRKSVRRSEPSRRVSDGGHDGRQAGKHCGGGDVSGGFHDDGNNKAGRGRLSMRVGAFGGIRGELCWSVGNPLGFTPRHPETGEGSRGKDECLPPSWILRPAQDDGAGIGWFAAI